MSVAPSADLSAYLAGLERRRDAASRLPVLDCGCRDPLGCDHREAPVEQATARYCCAALSFGQIAALAAAGRYCSESRCPRLQPGAA